jgi:serine/threonine protein kinase
MLLLNRYEYDPATDLLGKGNFSRVYRARDENTGRPVAIKLYKTGLMYRPVMTETIKKDLMSLDHPGVNKYISIEELEKEDAFGETEKIQVCVMETAEAGNISSYYASCRDDEKLKKILSDVIKGMSYLHHQHIIHRHIRPSNILVYTDGTIPTGKISDYSAIKDGGSNTGIAASFTGSVPYLAPEELDAQQYGIDGKVSYNIDIWLLGLTVYETITGEPLFGNSMRDSSEQVMKNILAGVLPEKILSLPEPFSTLVTTCLVKDAKERIQDAEELLDILNAASKNQAPSVDDTGLLSIATEEDQQGEDTDTMIIDRQPGKAENTALLQSDNGGENNTDDTGQVIIPSSQQESSDDTSILSGALSSVSTDDTGIIKNISSGNDDTEIIAAPAQERQHTPKEEPAPVQDETPKEGSIVLFNRYEYLPVADLIGRGGFSRVYKAYDRKLSRWVALKIYKTNDLSDRYSPFAEIKRVINLDNGNICRYLDIEEMENLNPFGEMEKIQVCVMELMDSGNIAEYYKAHPDPRILKKLLADILHGLSYLHKKGIIHRDIKPANILIKESIEGPVAKITDFGISKVSDTVGNNSTSALIVSIPFMAPEQFNTKKYGINNRISFNLDLWSLGVTIYEIFTGDVLFKDNDTDNSEQIMANIMAPELPQKINRLPEPFKAVVAHCLVKDARQRAQKAEDLIALLEDNKDIPFVPILPEEAATVISSGDVDSHYSLLPAAEHELNGVDHKISTTQPKKPFHFEYDEEEKIKKENKLLPHRKKILIAGGGLILLLLYFFFIKGFMNRNAVTVTPGKADSATHKNNKSGVDTSTNISEKPLSPTGNSDTAIVRNNANEHITGREEQSPKENNAGSRSGTKQKTAKQAANHETKVVDKLSVEIVTDQSCKLFLNGADYADLNAGYILKAYMKPGTYTLEAISKEGNKKFGKIISVKEVDMGKSLRVNISF